MKLFDRNRFVLKVAALAFLFNFSTAQAQTVSPVSGSGSFSSICGGTSADTQVLFNNAGACAGNAGLTYNTATSALSITGAVTGATFNKVTITSPASGSTLTIVNGKILTASNTLTFAGTDGSTLNVGAGGTLGTAAFQNTGTSGANLPFLNGVNTWAAQNTFAAGSISSSAPITFTQQWTGGGTFTGILENITDTSSASASLLMDLQVGAVSQVSATKAGLLTANIFNAGANGSASAPAIGRGNTGFYFSGSGGDLYYTNGGTYRLGSIAGASTPAIQLAAARSLGWESAGAGTAADVTLFRDAANTLALRNSTTAQKFNLYETFTDASNYSRLTTDYAASFFEIYPDAAGTGTFRGLFLGGGTLNLATGTSSGTLATRWQITQTGHLLANVDNTYDIGASGATRPRNVYVAGDGSFGGTVTGVSNVFTGTNSSFGWLSKGLIKSPSDGVVTLYNGASTDFSRLQFGGTTSSFPSLKRSTTTLAVRLADDSADGGFSAGTSTFSGTITAATINATGPISGANATSFVAGTNGGSLGQYAIKGNTSGTVFITTDATASTLLVTPISQTSAAQSGTVCYNSGTTAITYDATLGCLSSSMRFKHDWKPLTSALNKVLLLEAGSFVYNDSEIIPGEQIGLNAENMALIEPRLVGYDKDGKPRAVRYLNTIALLVKAIQEQQAQIEALKARSRVRH